MNGILITNKYHVSYSFATMKKFLLDAAHKYDIELKLFDNISIYDYIESSNYKRPDFVLFFDKDVKLARFLENMGLKLFNSSESIRICDDKASTYLHLQNKGIDMPKTIFSPLIYYHDIADDDEYIEYILNHTRFPFVYKECVGSFGQQVFLVNNKKELLDRISKSGTWPFIVQEFIESSFGKDLRLYVVGDKVVGSIKRENTSGDFRANIELGGVASKYIPSEYEKNIALKAKEVLNLDFCGVDILFGEGEKRYLCEVNSNAYFVGLNKVLEINVAEYIFEYIKKNISI